MPQCSASLNPESLTYPRRCACPLSTWISISPQAACVVFIYFPAAPTDSGGFSYMTHSRLQLRVKLGHRDLLLPENSPARQIKERKRKKEDRKKEDKEKEPAQTPIQIAYPQAIHGSDSL